MRRPETCSLRDVTGDPYSRSDFRRQPRWCSTWRSAVAVNAKFEFLGLYRISFGLAEITPDGILPITKIVSDFLDRGKARPHFTLRAKDMWAHFTAGRDNARRGIAPDREGLLTITPEIAAALKAWGEQLVPAFAAALEPADLAALEADGWKVVGLPAALEHLFRIGARKSYESARSYTLGIGAEGIALLHELIVSTLAPPTILTDFSSATYVRFVLMRETEHGSTELRALNYHATPFATSPNDDKLLHPGWYTSPMKSFIDAAAVEKLVPREKVVEIADTMRACLDRYPRLGKVPEPRLAVPDLALRLLTYYSPELRNLWFYSVLDDARARGLDLADDDSD